MHEGFLPFSRLDGSLHEFLNHRAVLAREVNVVLGALEELGLEVFEDERDLRLLLSGQEEGDETSADVGADAERADVHRPEVVPRAPVERDDDFAAGGVHLDDGRFHEVEQEDVAQRPAAHPGSLFPVHRFTLSGSILRRE